MSGLVSSVVGLLVLVGIDGFCRFCSLVSKFSKNAVIETNFLFLLIVFVVSGWFSSGLVSCGVGFWSSGLFSMLVFTFGIAPRFGFAGFSFSNCFGLFS